MADIRRRFASRRVAVQYTTMAASLVDLLGNSPAMVAIREQVVGLLRRESEAGRLPPILIEGETGTGKGLLARLIHRHSSRAAAPFVDISCAAIPENLLEAELFGFERSAFTDARRAKPGLFQVAHRGVVFLDEVGLLPDVLQGKLLKVIEERVVRRLGSVQGEPTDIWIIAATSDDLLGATRTRRFREDLYHRLAALTLRLPPVRERGEDVIRLAEHFLVRACRDYRLPPKTLDSDARQAMLRHAWPGNVRELANVMERVALLSEERCVTASALALPGGVCAAPAVDARPEPQPLRETVADVERRRLVESLAESGWNISRAAARLGIPRSSLRYRLEKHGLQPDTAAPMLPTVPETPATAAEPGTTGQRPGPRPVDWQGRHLAFLQIMLAAEAEREPGRHTQRLLQHLLDKVQSFGGRLEEQGPAGFLAVFGVEPVEDASTRAAHAALAVQNAVQRARDADPQVPTVVCALHAAHVLAGTAGTGVVIDMQARHRARAVLEGLTAGVAAGGAILASGEAAPLLERRFQLAPGNAAVPGAPRPYRVVAGEATGYGLADRCRDPGLPRSPGGEPAHGPAAPARELPPRVPAHLGQQDVLPAAPDRPLAARDLRGAA
jgi:DNA-binding NtrC family response regulator